MKITWKKIVNSLMGFIILFPIGLWVCRYIPRKYEGIIKPRIGFSNIRLLTQKDSLFLEERNLERFKDSYLVTLISNKRFSKDCSDIRIYCITDTLDLSYEEMVNADLIIESHGKFSLIKKSKDVYLYATMVSIWDIDGNNLNLAKTKKYLTCKIFFIYPFSTINETKKFMIPTNKLNTLFRDYENKMTEK